MLTLPQFRDFLGAGKASEAITPELRSKISIPTGLEAALLTALQNRRDVLIAGSAGGGKTHLLSTLRETPGSGLPALVPWRKDQPGNEPTQVEFIRVVLDATPLDYDDRFRVLTDKPANCVAVAMAINEGPLLEQARNRPDSPFNKSIRFLHAAQSGIRMPYDATAPTVIDVGGYNPIENGVVSQLLALPLLHELVNSLPCQCEDPRVCPRKLSWKLLKNEDVRKRVNDVLRVVNMLGQPVLFRELWDFVADLVLNGSCQDDVPTSAWFWRVFFGDSGLTRRLRLIADPLLVIYPRAEAHIWYGDYNSKEIDVLDGLNLIPLPRSQKLALTPNEYKWLKAELFFLVRSQSAMQVLKDQIDLRLASALRDENVQDIVEAINAYMSYGTIRPSQQVLQLWTDFSVEKRTERADGQVSLGSVPTAHLAIRRSLAVANHPDASISIPGARYFLVHRAENAPPDTSFLLSPEVLNILRGGRSYRTSDRPHTDVEWHISRFFSALAVLEANPILLETMALNFDDMSGRVYSYRLSTEANHIEPIGDE